MWWHFMLMLAITLQLGPGRHPLPEHLGGVLHGTVEAAALAQAPQLLRALRPSGDQATAHFAIQAPPASRLERVSFDLEDEPADPLAPQVVRFGVLLFGSAGCCWSDLLQALIRQTQRNIQGRQAEVLEASVWQPGTQAVLVYEEGSWQGSCVASDSTANAALTACVQTSMAQAPAALHQLQLRSPLLLASRGAAREGLQRYGQLPWPNLGRVLDSVAQRLLSLEPEIAEALGLPPDWRASDLCRELTPFTPANDPARQIEWTYRAAPRPKPGEPPAQARRSLDLPGIVGTLLYLSSSDPFESALLYWGQWLGMGQKTTMGCGQYVWRPLGQAEAGPSTDRH
jgi:hypothetical protein